MINYDLNEMGKTVLQKETGKRKEKKLTEKGSLAQKSVVAFILKCLL